MVVGSKGLIKPFLRKVFVSLKQRSDDWVIPRHVSKLWDDGHFDEARLELDRIEQVWGADDPEVIRARLFIDFMED